MNFRTLKTMIAGLIAGAFLSTAASAASLATIETTPGGETFSEIGAFSFNPSGAAFFDFVTAPVLTTMGLTVSGGAITDGTFTILTILKAVPVPSTPLAGTLADSAVIGVGGDTQVDLLFNVTGGTDAPLYDANLVLVSFLLDSILPSAVNGALAGTGAIISAAPTTLTFTEVQKIPLPPALLLMLSGFGALVLIKRRQAA